MDVSISKDTIPVIKDSANREIILIESKISIIKIEIKQFEDKYQMISAEFLKKFETGELGDSQDFFEWWGLLKGLGTLEDRLNKAKAVVIYW
jgi:hypothetical protein